MDINITIDFSKIYDDNDIESAIDKVWNENDDIRKMQSDVRKLNESDIASVFMAASDNEQRKFLIECVGLEKDYVAVIMGDCDDNE